MAATTRHGAAFPGRRVIVDAVSAARREPATAIGWVHQVPRLRTRCRRSCNNMMDEKSELMRESNALRDVAIEQKKADTQVMKKFIESII